MKIKNATNIMLISFVFCVLCNVNVAMVNASDEFSKVPKAQEGTLMEPQDTGSLPPLLETWENFKLTSDIMLEKEYLEQCSEDEKRIITAFFEFITEEDIEVLCLAGYRLQEIREINAIMEKGYFLAEEAAVIYELYPNKRERDKALFDFWFLIQGFDNAYAESYLEDVKQAFILGNNIEAIRHGLSMSLSLDSTTNSNSISSVVSSSVNIDNYLGNDPVAPFYIDEGSGASVNVRTGSFKYQYDILSIPGINGNDINLSVFYDSLQSQLGREAVDIYFGDYQGVFLVPYQAKYYRENGGEYIYAETVFGQAGPLLTYADADSWREDYNRQFCVDAPGEYYIMECYNVTGVFDPDYYSNYTINESTYEENSGLGVGWNWNLPSIEIIEDSRILHMGDGSSYMIQGPDTQMSLNGYTLENLKIEEDTSYQNGTYESFYVLKSVNGNRTYFDASGCLVSQMDKYDNTIKYEYGTFRQKSVLSKIIDTAGREINFSYSLVGTGWRVVITSPDGTTASILMTAIPSNKVDSRLYGHYVLSSIKDGKNNETMFEYNYGFGYANFFISGRLMIIVHIMSGQL